VDMDRYFREYSKMMEKAGNDKSKIANIESKYNVTKEGYNNLCDEMMSDMPKLLNDRLVLFEALSAAYIKASADFYDVAATVSNIPAITVKGINEENVHQRARGASIPIVPQPSAVYTPQAAPVVQAFPIEQTIPVQTEPISLTKQTEPVSLTKHTEPVSLTKNTEPVSLTKSPQPTAQPISSVAKPTPAAVKPTPTTTVKSTPIPPSKPVVSPVVVSLPQAQALFTFKAEEEGELSMKKGDIILLHSTEGDWWEGELNGIRGLLPSNYVKRL